MKRLLPLILLFLCSATLAESGAYRVEVIVFRNLAVVSEATEVEELRSYSHFPSLEEIRAPADLTEETVTESPEVLPEKPVPESPGFLPGELPEPPRSDLPDDLHVVTGKGPAMDDAWRRLRSSKNYRPLIYSAWEQNRTDYYPPMRIHDRNIIDKQLRPPGNILVADLAAEDPLAAYRSVFYRLDGGVQLRRSRFLHLFLDLEYREMKPQSVRVPGLANEDLTQVALALKPDNSVDYDVFALKQNRQIQTGRIQYFDTPYFGVLVLVSGIEAE